jgi:hypothetical protein
MSLSVWRIDGLDAENKNFGMTKSIEYPAHSQEIR